jgi:predicted RNA binding protein YcfA (HicA-like mRNA interferase family)
MSRPAVKVREAAIILRSAGFVDTDHPRHWRFKHPDGRVVTLPKSKKRDIYGFMEQKILKIQRGEPNSYDKEGGAHG